MDLKDILIGPIITEKSTALIGEGNKYTLRVALNAKKSQIREAIEKTYGVKVIKINVAVVPGKRRRSLKMRKEFKKADWKKVIVQLGEGQKIEAFEFPTEERKREK